MLLKAWKICKHQIKQAQERIHVLQIAELNVKRFPRFWGFRRYYHDLKIPGCNALPTTIGCNPQTVNENTLFHLIEVVSQILSCISLIRDSEDFHDMNRYISKVYNQIVNKIDFYWVL